MGVEVQSRIFDRFGMTMTSMQWRPDFRNNLADGFRKDGSSEPHDERRGVSAAGSMDTTIEDQAKLWAGIVRGEGLSSASRIEFVRCQIAIDSQHQFPTLSPETNPDHANIGLSAGLGMITFRTGNGPIWFKGGHNDWTGNMLICIENQKRCLVLLSNDVRAEKIYPELTLFILGETGMPWQWEYND